MTPLVVCRDAALTFGSGPAAVVAVHGATCQVEPGERIAITGASGSGKSSLLHLLAGLETPTAGTVSWPALDDGGAQRPSGARIGVVFQSPSLIPTLDVVENIALPLQLAGLAPGEIAARTARSLAMVDATALAGRLPEELSGGQAQRVATARVLAHQPGLILADEPTGQLDRETGRRVLDALVRVATDLGAGLVITTHDSSVAARLETRWTMTDGRLSTAGDREARWAIR